MSGGKSRKEAGERKAENESPSRACTRSRTRARASTHKAWRKAPDYWPVLEAEAARLSADTGRRITACHVREMLCRAFVAQRQSRA
jgi:hypothetical protein